MGKSHKSSSRAAAHSKPGPRQGTGPPDGAVYIGVAMVGVFGVWLWAIVAPPGYWKHGLMGYVIAVLVLVNLAAWRICLGNHLPPWQQSLARLVLRWAGYGTPGGRPLDAAHGSGRAKSMLLVSLGVSLAVIAALALVLYR